MHPISDYVLSIDFQILVVFLHSWSYFFQVPNCYAHGHTRPTLPSIRYVFYFLFVEHACQECSQQCIRVHPPTQLEGEEVVLALHPYIVPILRHETRDVFVSCSQAARVGRRPHQFSPPLGMAQAILARAFSSLDVSGRCSLIVGGLGPLHCRRRLIYADLLHVFDGLGPVVNSFLPFLRQKQPWPLIESQPGFG